MSREYRNNVITNSLISLMKIDSIFAWFQTIIHCNLIHCYILSLSHTFIHSADKIVHWFCLFCFVIPHTTDMTQSVSFHVYHCAVDVVADLTESCTFLSIYTNKPRLSTFPNQMSKTNNRWLKFTLLIQKHKTTNVTHAIHSCQ